MFFSKKIVLTLICFSAGVAAAAFYLSLRTSDTTYASSLTEEFQRHKCWEVCVPLYQYDPRYKSRICGEEEIQQVISKFCPSQFKSYNDPPETSAGGCSVALTAQGSGLSLLISEEWGIATWKGTPNSSMKCLFFTLTNGDEMIKTISGIAGIPYPAEVE